MSWRRMIWMGWIMGLALVASAPLGWTQAPATSHSGVILAVNREAGTLVLGEIEPWRVKGRATEITGRTFVVTSTTQFRQVKRAAGAGPLGWIGELVEVRLGAWEVEKGDFVTVEAWREGQRLTALTIVVVMPSEP